LTVPDKLVVAERDRDDAIGPVGAFWRTGTVRLVRHRHEGWQIVLRHPGLGTGKQNQKALPRMTAPIR
jgi:hypothetical protein